VVEKAPKKKAKRKSKKRVTKPKGALVIVESPAKCRTIEKILGKNFTVQASMGHIIDLPKSKMGVDVENDFAPPLHRHGQEAQDLNAAQETC